MAYLQAAVSKSRQTSESRQSLRRRRCPRRGSPNRRVRVRGCGLRDLHAGGVRVTAALIVGGALFLFAAFRAGYHIGWNDGIETARELDAEIRGMDQPPAARNQMTGETRK